jgi:hypothetical protein
MISPTGIMQITSNGPLLQGKRGTLVLLFLNQEGTTIRGAKFQGPSIQAYAPLP